MNAKFVLIAVLLFFIPAAFFAQPGEVEAIPVEPLYPVKTVQSNEGVSFRMPWFIYYNRYDGNVYVVDQKEHHILVFDDDLNYLDTVGRYGQGEIEFNYPAGIAFDGNGDMYICDVMSNRVQVVDKNRNFVLSFKCRFDDHQPEICLDSKGRIYINIPSNNALISVLDKKGNLIDKFGKLNHSENRIERKHFNLVRMIVDEEDNIYCAFQEFPVLRKYDRNFNLVYEKQYAHLPEVIEKTRDLELKRDQQKNPKIHFFKLLNMNLALDGDFLFLGFLLTDSNPLYCIDKKNGEISRKIILRSNESESGFFYRFDASDRDFLFSTDIEKKVLHKFKKIRYR